MKYPAQYYSREKWTRRYCKHRSRTKGSFYEQLNRNDRQAKSWRDVTVTQPDQLEQGSAWFWFPSHRRVQRIKARGSRRIWAYDDFSVESKSGFPLDSRQNTVEKNNDEYRYNSNIELTLCICPHNTSVDVTNTRKNPSQKEILFHTRNFPRKPSQNIKNFQGN